MTSGPQLQLLIGGKAVTVTFDSHRKSGGWHDFYVSCQVPGEPFCRAYTILCYDEMFVDEQGCREMVARNGAWLLSTLLRGEVGDIEKFLPDLCKEVTEKVIKFIQEELLSGKQRVPCVSCI